MNRPLRLIQKILINILKLYKRIISPILPPTCRFYPTCSEYSIEAIRTFGPIKGMWLSFKRILRCNPFHKSGYDPVPTKANTIKH